MDIFLVGGAVRDQLLGHPYDEHDYVVVGATAEQLIAQGFQPVGKDFPVFLHPETKEEYALARVERKVGAGYTGFTCHSTPDVTLEQDLLRRDLTINAMAKHHNGTIIDPYGGQKDLENKILRHVSDAFIEDPLRVLRVARFAARYAPYGFSIAPETLELMKQLAQSGELNHLTAERVWKETSRALMEDYADVYFQVLRDCGALKVLFPEIDALFGVPQRPEHHPEIDCGIHTLMSLRQACRQNYALEVRFCALTHDLGKALTPVDILPRHTLHEERGVPVVESLCQRLKVPTALKNLAMLVCKEHLKCHRVIDLKAGSLWRLLQKLDVLRQPDRIIMFAQTCESDARGRLGLENRPYPQKNYIIQAANIVKKIKAHHLPPDIKGPDIGEALIQKRIDALAAFKADYLLELSKHCN